MYSLHHFSPGRFSTGSKIEPKAEGERERKRSLVALWLCGLCYTYYCTLYCLAASRDGSAGLPLPPYPPPPICTWYKVPHVGYLSYLGIYLGMHQQPQSYRGMWVGLQSEHVHIILPAMKSHSKKKKGKKQRHENKTATCYDPSDMFCPERRMVVDGRWNTPQ